MHGGTESHIVRYGWRLHRSSEPQTQGYSAWLVAQNHMFSDTDGGGTDLQILKPRDICSAWWNRNPYCQIRIAAAQILISPPVYHLNVGLLSIVFWKLDHYCRTPGHGEQELFSATASVYVYLLTYIQCQCLLWFVDACCHALSLQTAQVSCITIFLYQIDYYFCRPSDSAVCHGGCWDWTKNYFSMQWQSHLPTLG